VVYRRRRGLGGHGPLARAIEALGEGHVAVDQDGVGGGRRGPAGAAGDPVALRQLAAADVVLLNK